MKLIQWKGSHLEKWCN